MRRSIVFVALFFLPQLALAATFPHQSIFLSENAPTEGDRVLVHTVVSNDASIPFSGELAVSDEGGPIGTAPVSLMAGEASTVTVRWVPAAGIRTVTARLRTRSGDIVEETTAQFTVAPKPQPAGTASASAPAAVESSAPVVATIAGISPGAARVATPAFKLLDAGRSAAAKTLDGGITWSKQQLGGAVLGAQTERAAGATTTNASQGVGATLWKILATFVLFLLSILRYVVASAGIFYPVAAILFFFAMWRLYRRMRRPRYR